MTNNNLHLDSNPRYGNPYGSLANCWFKPLTHLTFGLTGRQKYVFFAKKQNLVHIFVLLSGKTLILIIISELI